MKEEELLLFKEELAGIKRNRDCLVTVGIVIFAVGIIMALIQVVTEALNVARGTGTLTLLPQLFVVTSGAVVIVCFTAGFAFDRAYQDKLKELKK